MEWPATKTDPYTEAEVDDWDQAPARVEIVRAKIEPVSSTEETVTAETIVSRWECTLPPTFPVTSRCRIRRADGSVYAVDGEVSPWKRGTRTRFLTCLLKKVA